MGEFSLWHLILILGVILIFFGPSRLPGLGNSLGKAIRGFKSGMKGINEDEKEAKVAPEALPSSEKSESEVVSKDKSKNNQS